MKTLEVVVAAVSHWMSASFVLIATLVAMYISLSAPWFSAYAVASSGNCAAPHSTFTCAAAGVVMGVVCDNGTMCKHEVWENSEIIWWEPSDSGFEEFTNSGAPKMCHILLFECNPFGSPPCLDSGLDYVARRWDLEFAIECGGSQMEPVD